MPSYTSCPVYLPALKYLSFCIIVRCLVATFYSGSHCHQTQLAENECNQLHGFYKIQYVAIRGSHIITEVSTSHKGGAGVSCSYKRNLDPRHSFCFLGMQKVLGCLLLFPFSFSYYFFVHWTLSL